MEETRNDLETMNGCIMAIGGNEDKSLCPDTILSEFVRRAGGANARIVIVPFASASPVRRAEMYTSLFAQLGAREVSTLEVGPEESITDFSPLSKATGIFVTGGDQTKLMLLLNRAGYAEAIRDAVSRGAVYAGTSAGAAAISRSMIAGSRWLKPSMGEGLGLAPAVVIDQHFSERGRLPRLLRAIESTKLFGIGIDENTVAVFESGGRLTIQGAGKVTVVPPVGSEAFAYGRRELVLQHGEVVELPDLLST